MVSEQKKEQGSPPVYIELWGSLKNGATWVIGKANDLVSWLKDEITELRGDIKKTDQQLAKEQARTEEEINALDETAKKRELSPEELARKEKLEAHLEEIKEYRAKIQDLNEEAASYELELNDPNHPVSNERALEIAARQKEIAQELEGWQKKIETATAEVRTIEASIAPDDVESHNIAKEYYGEILQIEIIVSDTTETISGNGQKLVSMMDGMTPEQQAAMMEDLAAAAISVRNINGSMDSVIAALSASGETGDLTTSIAELSDRVSASEAVSAKTIEMLVQAAKDHNIEPAGSFAKLIRIMSSAEGTGVVAAPEYETASPRDYTASQDSYANATYDVIRNALDRADEERDQRRAANARDDEHFLDLEIAKNNKRREEAKKKEDGRILDRNWITRIRERGKVVKNRLNALRANDPLMTDSRTTMLDFDAYRALARELYEDQQKGKKN